MEDLSCKFGHKMAGTLSTFISLKVLSCMPNCKVTKMLMQEEQHASVGAPYKEFDLMAISVKITKGTNRSDWAEVSENRHNFSTKGML